jgi:hypothetical protein
MLMTQDRYVELLVPMIFDWLNRCQLDVFDATDEQVRVAWLQYVNTHPASPLAQFYWEHGTDINQNFSRFWSLVQYQYYQAVQSL